MAKRTTKKNTSAKPTRPSTSAGKAKPAASSTAHNAPKLKASEQVKAAVAAEANARRNPAARPTAPTGASPVITISQEEIAERAYLIWLAKGKPHGLDEVNWLEAEAQLHRALAHA